MDISRNLNALFLASLVSVVLFYGMHLLIKRDPIPIPENPFPHRFELLKMPKDINPPIVIAPKPPSHVQKQPEKQKLIIEPDNSIVSIDENIRDIPGKKIKIEPGGRNQSHMTIVPIAPSYPPEMAEKCIEGFVITGFTITSSGSVSDPFIVNTSHQGFNRSALRAIKKFKFKPKMINGQPVASPDGRYKFSYQLDDC